MRENKGRKKEEKGRGRKGSLQEKGQKIKV
jgi:hypothetical protein